MKTLHLTIRKKWFDMIKARIKKEEYRELTSYWIKRLMKNTDVNNPKFKDFDSVILANGGHFGDVPKYAIPYYNITIGYGRPEWGAVPGVKYFIIES